MNPYAFIYESITITPNPLIVNNFNKISSIVSLLGSLHFPGSVLSCSYGKDF
jgi:hypothetical protein